MISIEPLATILRLEQQNGCSNRTVIGGLDAYLQKWYTETRTALVGSRRLTPIVTRFSPPGFSYASLSKEQRQDWVQQALGWLEQIAGQHSKPRPVREGTSVVKPARAEIPPARTRA
ncbi:MAG: hypothetical protein V1737_00690, partial [Chloroflexota bacterium]